MGTVQGDRTVTPPSQDPAWPQPAPQPLASLGVKRQQLGTGAGVGGWRGRAARDTRPDSALRSQPRQPGCSWAWVNDYPCLPRCRLPRHILGLFWCSWGCVLAPEPTASPTTVALGTLHGCQRSSQVPPSCWNCPVGIPSGAVGFQPWGVSAGGPLRGSGQPSRDGGRDNPAAPGGHAGGTGWGHTAVGPEMGAAAVAELLGYWSPGELSGQSCWAHGWILRCHRDGAERPARG